MRRSIERDVLIDLCWRTPAYRRKADAAKHGRPYLCILGGHYHAALATEEARDG
jgi:hypothetical protein